MNPPGHDITPLRIGASYHRLRDRTDLPYLLQFFNPVTLEQKFALSEAYAIANDYVSSKDILMQIRSDVESVSRQTMQYPIQRLCNQLTLCVDNNVDTLTATVTKKLESSCQITSYMKDPPGPSLKKKDALKAVPSQQ